MRMGGEEWVGARGCEGDERGFKLVERGSSDGCRVKGSSRMSFL